MIISLCVLAVLIVAACWLITRHVNGVDARLKAEADALKRAAERAEGK